MDPVPGLQSVYARTLLQARQAGYAVTAANEERIRAAFADVLRALLRDVAEGVITPARGRLLREQALRLLSAFETVFADGTDAAVRLTAEQVALLHKRALQELFGAVRLTPPASVLAQLDVLPSRAVAAVLSRFGNAETFRTVARRQLRAAVPQIDVLIDSAVARGVSAGRLTADLATVLANGDADLIARLPASLSSSLHRGVGQIDLSRYGLSPDEVRRARGILYDARRIAVSETNNALREASTQALQASPTVEAAVWQRSGRHGGSDACDALAELDLYGYGPGYYPADAFPVAPHPHCACTHGGPVIARPVRDWLKPKGPGRPLQADPSDADLYGRWKDTWSDAEGARVRAGVAEVVRSAEAGRR